jgi:hypothetical protein
MRFGIVVLALAVTGCGSSIEGEWEADGVGCGDIELSVLPDEQVEMELPLVNGAGDCVKCKFEGDYKEQDNGDFDFDLDGEGLCEGIEFEGECTLSDDGEELSCDTGGSDDTDFKKKN